MTSLTYKDAMSILETDPRSCFHKVNAIKHMILPPRYIGNVKKGVIEELNSELRLSSEMFGGALIAYDNIKLQQHVGVIMDEQPYIHFDIQADFIVFKPVIGCNLTGVVNKISSHHIGCLVHSCFNASIPKPCDDSAGWRGSELTVGEEFSFEVTKVYTYNKMLTLRGKFPDISPLKHRKRKRQPHENGVHTEDSIGDSVSLHTEHSSDYRPTGKKRKKHADNSFDQFNGQIINKKGKNPRKKQKETDKRISCENNSSNDREQPSEAGDSSNNMDVSTGVVTCSPSKRKHKKRKYTGDVEDDNDVGFSSSQDLFVDDSRNKSTDSSFVSTKGKKAKKLKKEKHNSERDNGNMIQREETVLDNRNSELDDSSHVYSKTKKAKKLKKEKHTKDSENNNTMQGGATVLDSNNMELDRSLDTATKKQKKKKKKNKEKRNETM